MTKDPEDVVIPQLGVNDNAATIVSWKIQPGDPVARGQAVAEIENSKGVVDLESEQEGYIFPVVEAGSEVPVGRVIAIISSNPNEPLVKQYISKSDPENAGTKSQGPPVRMTDSARELVEQHQIDPDSLPRDRIIRESDVNLLLEIDSAVFSEVEVLRCGNIVIYGASQGGLVALECLRAMGGYRAVAFLDNNAEKIGTIFQGLPVWPESELETLCDRGVGGVITHIANRDFRIKLKKKAASSDLALPNVIHPRAMVAESAQMGVGNLIKAGAILDTEVQLGDLCLIDNGVIIPHHNILDDACHVAPGVRMGGNCRVGERTLLGTGSVIASGIRIGKNVIVAPGSCVVRDVEDEVIVQGDPARVVGERSRGAQSRSS